MNRSRLEDIGERSKVVLLVLAFGALICGSCYMELSVWDECREQHSFLYCYRTVIRD